MTPLHIATRMTELPEMEQLNRGPGSSRVY